MIIDLSRNNTIESLISQAYEEDLKRNWQANIHLKFLSSFWGVLYTILSKALF